MMLFHIYYFHQKGLVYNPYYHFIEGTKLIFNCNKMSKKNVVLYDYMRD